MTSTWTDETTERADVALREAFVGRLRQELRHTPGVALTVAQASRLFDLPQDVCGRLLGALAEQGTICWRPDGRFVGIGKATTRASVANHGLMVS